LIFQETIYFGVQKAVSEHIQPRSRPYGQFRAHSLLRTHVQIKELALTRSLGLALEAGQATAHLFHIITVSYLRGNAGGYADLS